MRTMLHGLAAAGLATAVTLAGLAATAGDAEAGHRHRHRHGLTIILGDGPGHGHGCGWLYWKWEQTGHPKWYSRWHHCEYGW